MKKYIKGIGFYAILLAVIFVIYFMLNFSTEPTKIEFGELVNDIKNQEISTLEIIDIKQL